MIALETFLCTRQIKPKLGGKGVKCENSERNKLAVFKNFTPSMTWGFLCGQLVVTWEYRQ
jgi:hypothetical protein